MTRHAWCIAIVAILTLAPILSAATNISGSWKASFSTDVGEQSYTYEFKVTGTELRGRVRSANGDVELLNGKVTGDTVSFVEEITFRGRDLQIEYVGKIVSNDEIRFTREINKQFTEHLIARRVK